MQTPVKDMSSNDLKSPGLDVKTHNSTDRIHGIDLSHKVDNSPGLFKNESVPQTLSSQNMLDIKKSQNSSGQGKNSAKIEDSKTEEQRTEQLIKPQQRQLYRASQQVKPEFYDMSKKPKFQSKPMKNFPNKCALEHDKKFKKKIEQGNKAMKKLFFVSFICFIFMGLEFAGGILSGSLAILTDAAHMFSDVAGFMISFFSIYISQNQSTFDYSMGYHRAEILGAFVSIFLIWGLLGWLNYEATQRILHPPEKAIDADLMLITACIGFLCNITNFCALNASCGAQEEEDDAQDLGSSQKSVIGRSLAESLMAVYQPKQAHKCIRQEMTHDKSIDGISQESCHEEDCEAHNHNHNTAAAQLDFNQSNENRYPLHSVEFNQTNGQNQTDDRQNLLNLHQSQLSKKSKGMEQNMNIRAAMIHILGDMVQSIGVIAASLILKFKTGPEWQKADPICTYIFSVLVLLTTVPIFCDCVRIIMEASPNDIDTEQLYNDILNLKTVEEVHDFHCWSLAGGKYMLTMHIRSAFGEIAIDDINKICKQKDYGIFHTTVQVEKERKNAKSISCCHNS